MSDDFVIHWDDDEYRLVLTGVAHSPEGTCVSGVETTEMTKDQMIEAIKDQSKQIERYKENIQAYHREQAEEAAAAEILEIQNADMPSEFQRGRDFAKNDLQRKLQEIATMSNQGSPNYAKLEWARLHLDLDEFTYRPDDA
jgi:hypothetical protein